MIELKLSEFFFVLEFFILQPTRFRFRIHLHFPTWQRFISISAPSLNEKNPKEKEKEKGQSISYLKLLLNTYLKYYFFNVSWGFSPVFLGFYAIHLIWQFASWVLFAVTSRFYRVLSNISMSFLIFKAYFKAFFNLSLIFDMAVCLKSSICCYLKILPGFIKYLNVWLDFDFYLKFF